MERDSLLRHVPTRHLSLLLAIKNMLKCCQDREFKINMSDTVKSVEEKVNNMQEKMMNLSRALETIKNQVEMLKVQNKI